MCSERYKIHILFLWNTCEIFLKGIKYLYFILWNYLLTIHLPLYSSWGVIFTTLYSSGCAPSVSLYKTCSYYSKGENYSGNVYWVNNWLWVLNISSLHVDTELKHFRLIDIIQEILIVIIQEIQEKDFNQSSENICDSPRVWPPLACVPRPHSELLSAARKDCHNFSEKFEVHKVGEEDKWWNFLGL